MFFHFLARIIAALWGSSCALPTWAHGFDRATRPQPGGVIRATNGMLPSVPAMLHTPVV
ncbi:dTDP-glucose 4,6-dehydratase [Burkholderia pseudomallei MSHR5492]|nr:dTDP-glucose 4,6-dehydratase [Burkholderia pseudomallei MSHR5492]